MRSLVMIFVLSTVSCQAAPPRAHRFEAPPEKVLDAVLHVLRQYGEVAREGDVFEIYWRPDESPRAVWKGIGTVLDSESRFKVRLDGTQVAVEARSRLFVHRGTRRRDWEEVDPGPATARLLERIETRLQ